MITPFCNFQAFYKQPLIKRNNVRAVKMNEESKTVHFYLRSKTCNVFTRNAHVDDNHSSKQIFLFSVALHRSRECLNNASS